MTRIAVRALLGALLTAGLASGALAQSKKELVQKILQIQQAEIEAVARNIVTVPAERMMQEAGVVIQRQVPQEKREAVGKAVELEVKKYTDEVYPLARERALKIAPVSIGSTLEEKFTEDELKQLVAWFESPVNKKYQQTLPDLRNGFIQKLVAELKPTVDPKVQALDGRLRAVFGVPPNGAAPAPSAPAALTSTRPAPPAARASGK